LDPRLCGPRGSTRAPAAGFGADGRYVDEAEVGVAQVWPEPGDDYAPGPPRPLIPGYSMGGFASYKLGLTYPDLFASAMPRAGPPVCGLRVHGSIVGHAGPGRCTDDGDTTPLVANARWLRYDIADGGADELVPFAGGL